jgi:hypothetical protein
VQKDMVYLRRALKRKVEDIRLKEKALIANFQAEKNLIESKVSELLHQLHKKGVINLTAT